jgi:PAS domain S-box-containing protein
MDNLDLRGRAILEHLPDLVLICDSQGRIEWVGPTAGSQEAEPSKLTGRSAFDFIHAADRDRVRESLRRALGQPAKPLTVLGVRMTVGSTGTAFFDQTLTYLPDAPGIGGLLLLSRRSLESEELRVAPEEETASERALREREERLRQAVRLTGIGIFDHDHVTGEIYWSAEQRQIYGWGAEEPVLFSRSGLSPSETWNLVHPDDRQRLLAAIEHAHNAPDGQFEITYRIIRRDGTLRWLSSRSQTFFSTGGTGRCPLRTIGAVQDITERLAAERELRFAQTAVERSNTSIYWITPDGEVTYANEHACQSLGRTRDELVGLHVWDFDPDFSPERWGTVAATLKERQSLVTRTRHRRKDGTSFPVEAIGDFLVVDGEEHIFVFAQDISARESAERDLQLLSAAINNSRTAFFSVGPNGRIVYANEAASDSLGLTHEELLSSHLWDFNPDIPPELNAHFWETLKARGMQILQTRHRRKDGTIIPVEVTSNYFAFKGEEYSLASAQDITERMATELALRQSQERLQQVMKVYDIGIFEHDHVNDTLYWSPELRKAWNLGDAQPQVDLIIRTIAPEDYQRVDEAAHRAFDPRGDGRFEVQMRVMRSDGQERWIDSRSQTFFEGEGSNRHPVRTVGAMVDITARVAQEIALRDSLQEKETLLREVHHRVKNNLQIIASLLHFQAKKVRDPADLAAFADGRDRLRAMILVHEKLYQSRDLSRIDFSSYLKVLVRDLQQSYSARGRDVAVSVATDPVGLPIQIAVPCGMIVCELLTNVFKYAFPNGGSGAATVSLTADGPEVKLGVSDNGVGLPESFDPRNSSSFGWQLIRNLTAQVGGEVSVERSSGTRVLISFANTLGGS